MSAAGANRAIACMCLLSFGIAACRNSVRYVALAAPAAPRFVDVSAQSGVVHDHVLPVTEQAYLRNLGGGVVMDDLDGDGRLDLLLTNAGGPNGLFWNRGGFTFDRAVAAAGVGLDGAWTNSASAADLDGDGDLDLVTAGPRGVHVLRNEGDRTFTDVTGASGVTATANPLALGFGDLDRDGRVDLVVGHGIHIDGPAAIPECGADAWKGAKYTPPSVWRGLGDLRFEDASAAMATFASALTEPTHVVGLVDLDDDGDLDLYYTTDNFHSAANRIVWNRTEPGGALSFEIAPPDPVTLHPAGAMGIAVLDVDKDLRPDVFVTNLAFAPPFREVLLSFRVGGAVVDVAEEYAAIGLLTGPEGRLSSWAAVPIDVSNRGYEDLVVVYGHLDNGFGCADDAPGTAAQKDEPDLLLRVDATSGIFDLGSDTGLEDPGQGRGAAVGDLDDDGCPDLVVVNLGGRARVHRNECRGAGHWIDLDLVPPAPWTDPVGSKVTISTAGGRQVRWVLAGVPGVYSSSPRRVHFGLGTTLTTVDEVVVRWPSGAEQNFGARTADLRHTLSGRTR